jgi:hypothetical protein
MTPEDKPIVDLIHSQMEPFGIDCYIAERDWKFGESLSRKVEVALKQSDCILALLTRGGSQSAYVNQEIGMASGQGKLVIPIVEDGVDLKGFQQGVEWVHFDRASPEGMVRQLTPRITALAAKKDVNVAIAMAVLAVIALWAFKK